ncbi:hypothetical protein Tcan_00115 [Toxocara canis]|uniref:Uncharacterized protein n=1 Tax=Toxocara canis TaxID=6265 RepID=A0A0B2W0M2_TOXCA|nr:hypothetical protein Tcan_00115 [Toxocara canis]
MSSSFIIRLSAVVTAQCCSGFSMNFLIRIIQWILYTCLFVFVCIVLYFLRYRELRECPVQNVIDVPSARIVRSDRISKRKQTLTNSRPFNSMSHLSRGFSEEIGW